MGASLFSEDLCELGDEFAGGHPPAPRDLIQTVLAFEPDVDEEPLKDESGVRIPLDHRVDGLILLKSLPFGQDRWHRAPHVPIAVCGGSTTIGRGLNRFYDVRHLSCRFH